MYRQGARLRFGELLCLEWDHDHDLVILWYHILDVLDTEVYFLCSCIDVLFIFIYSHQSGKPDFQLTWGMIPSGIIKWDPFWDNLMLMLKCMVNFKDVPYYISVDICTFPPIRVQEDEWKNPQKIVYEVWVGKSYHDPHPLRPRPHLLLLGDPGTGKSQLLQAKFRKFHGETWVFFGSTDGEDRQCAF